MDRAGVKSWVERFNESCDKGAERTNDNVARMPVQRSTHPICNSETGCPPGPE